jgi:zinc protease
MNRIVHTLVALVVLLGSFSSGTARAVDRRTPPPLGPVVPFVVPSPESFTLGNGLRVFLLERHRAPLVDVVVSINNGGLDDAPARAGEAVALASLLTQGSSDHDAFAFSEATARLGARIDAGADLTSTQVRLHVASARLSETLPLLADAVLRPSLTGEDWSRKRDEALGTIAYLRDDADALAELAALRALYGTTRLGTSVMGTGVSLSSTSIEDLRAMHSRAFRPDNAFIVVVGDVAPLPLVSALEQNFGHWTAPKTPLPSRDRMLEPPASDDVDVVAVKRPGAPQSTLLIVAPAPADLSPFHPATAVVETLLGGSFTSRLNTNLREEHGYSYGAGFRVDVWPARHWRLSTDVATAVTIPALLEIENELTRIREPATDDEIVRARSYEALTFSALFDGGDSIARVLTAWKEQGITDDVVAGYTARVLSIDKAEMQTAAQRLVDRKRRIITVVGDVEDEALARFGSVTHLTADDLLPFPTRTAATKTPQQAANEDTAAPTQLR